MARNILLTRLNWLTELSATPTGGAWNSNLSLINLLDMNPQVVAEVTNNNTFFTVDLGATRKVGLFSFANMNTTAAATLTFQAGTDPTFAVNNYSAATKCWPQTMTIGTDPWGAATATGIVYADEFAALGKPRFLIPPAPIDCRYIKVAINDLGNPLPFQIGHFGAWLTWESPRNLSYDWQMVPVDESEIDRVPGGSTYITERKIRRRLAFGIKLLSENEAFARTLSLLLVNGRRRPLVAIPYPDKSDVAIAPERNGLYGTMSADSPLSNPFFGRYGATFQIDQLV